VIKAFSGVGCSIVIAIAASCAGTAPGAITPTLPGDGDGNIAKDPVAPTTATTTTDPSATPAGPDQWTNRKDLISAPAAAPASKINLPPSESITLANGLSIIMIKSSSQPVVSFQLAVKAGRTSHWLDLAWQT
jgi:hypothetical protein